MLIKQFSLFLICGGLAAGFNFASRFFFSVFFPFEIAVILAFLVGLFSGFILMRLFVFEGAGKPLSPQIGKYLAVNLLALAQTLLISIVCARWLLPAIGVDVHAEALGHLAGVLLPVVSSYFGHKLLTFR